MYALMIWDGGWKEVERGNDPLALMDKAKPFGSIGDDWTIRCLLCNRDSKFHGCSCKNKSV